MSILRVLFRSGRVRDAIIVSLLLGLTVAPTMRAASDVHLFVAHADSHAARSAHVHGSAPQATVAPEGEVETFAHRLLHLPTCSDASSMPGATAPFGMRFAIEGPPVVHGPSFPPSPHAELPYRPPIVS